MSFLSLKTPPSIYILEGDSHSKLFCYNTWSRTKTFKISIKLILTCIQKLASVDYTILCTTSI